MKFIWQPLSAVVMERPEVRPKLEALGPLELGALRARTFVTPLKAIQSQWAGGDGLTI